VLTVSSLAVSASSCAMDWRSRLANELFRVAFAMAHELARTRLRRFGFLLTPLAGFMLNRQLHGELLPSLDLPDLSWRTAREQAMGSLTERGRDTRI